MQRTMTGLRIPEGMRDLLPDELKLQEDMEKKIVELLQKWSYQKVLTPTLEYAACVQPEIDGEDKLYKFFDRNGKILALRPELTTPIARLVSTRLRGKALPIRLCYAADVLRYCSARYREFRQVGVELVGADAGMADAEVIALAVEAIQCLGFRDFQFNLGHMGIFSGLMVEAGIDEELQGQLENALARKDMVAVETLVQRSHLPKKVKQLLLQLPHFHGREEVLDEVLEWSEKPIKEAVEGLRQVYRSLKDFGVQEYVSLDFGILRDFSYYTGVIFEGYIPGIGFPVVEGGRYDSLYSDFGYPLPATGFAINLGSCLTQLPLPSVDSADVLVYGKDSKRLIGLCQVLRAQGKRVEMALQPLSEQQARQMADQKHILQVLCADEA